MRLGLLIPAVNTVSEGEFHAGVPPWVTVHTARMHVAGTTADHVRQMIAESLPQGARDLAAIRPDVLVLACTAVGAVLGAEGEARLCQELEERWGAPIVSMNLAVREMLARTGATDVAVLTPYPDDVTAKVADGLRADGLNVPVQAGLGFADAFHIAEISADELTAFVEAHVTPGKVGALLLSCGNLRVLEARERLQERYGVPVVASNLAALDLAIERLEELRG